MQYLFLIIVAIPAIFYTVVLIKNRAQPDEFFSEVVARRAWSRHTMRILTVFLVGLCAAFFFGLIAPKFELGSAIQIIFTILLSLFCLLGLIPSNGKISGPHFVFGMAVVVLSLTFVSLIVATIWGELELVPQLLFTINLTVIICLTILGFVVGLSGTPSFVKEHLLAFQTVYVVAIALILAQLTYL